MKKILIFLVLVMVWLGSNGQTEPVLPYNYPPKQTLRNLAMTEDAKGYAYSSYLVEKLNLGLRDTTLRLSRAHLEFIFNNLFLEEVDLEEGGYLNSGYNPGKQKMEPSVGHKRKGFVWVFRVGTYSIPIIKDDCGNILVAPVMRKAIVEAPSLPKKPLEETVAGVNVEVVSGEPESVPFVAPKTIKEMMTTSIPDTYQEPVIPAVEKKNKKWLWVSVPVATVAAGTLAYLIIKNNNNHSTPGGPAGVPPHDDGK